MEAHSTQSLYAELATQLQASLEPRLTVALKGLSCLGAGVLASPDFLLHYFIPTANTSPQAALLEKAMVYVNKIFTALANADALLS